ncbi:hypothetical protein CcCBS67573_g07804 [Chytriomyces confervae]|uniref:Homeobox domain-containing protein n=1 Tax=Chytriomyces confervae TaxID=246404 RepID=A0A507ERN5_9FUNG|nr:hypothetical protein CcCBS67573_g07804 [Chytriomyces confervae]
MTSSGSSVVEPVSSKHMPVSAESLLLDYSFDLETSLSASKLMLPNLSMDSIYSTSSSAIHTPNLQSLQQHLQYSSQYSCNESEQSLLPAIVKTETVDTYDGLTAAATTALVPSNSLLHQMESAMSTQLPTSCLFISGGAALATELLLSERHLVIKAEMNLSDTNSDEKAASSSSLSSSLYYPAADMQSSPTQFMIDDLLSANLPDEPGMELLLPLLQEALPSCAQESKQVTTNKTSNRFRATPSELNLLLSIFERNAFPSRILRQKLADHLRLSVRQIQLWFQNRRASLKSNGSVFKHVK